MKASEVPKAGAGQVHEEPKNIEWVCAQIADCVWGCSWPPLDLTEEEISRIREGAQYLMTSLRPSTAANTEGLRAERAEADIEKLKMDAEHLQYERDEAREANVRLVAALEMIRDECRDVAHVEGIEVAEKRTWISMAAIADAALSEARTESRKENTP